MVLIVLFLNYVVISIKSLRKNSYFSCKLWGTVSIQATCFLDFLHARIASFTNLRFWQLGILAIRHECRPEIRYPVCRLTLTHLRSGLKSGLSAESERIAQAIRNSFIADNQASSKNTGMSCYATPAPACHFLDFSAPSNKKFI